MSDQTTIFVAIIAALICLTYYYRMKYSKLINKIMEKRINTFLEKNEKYRLDRWKNTSSPMKSILFVNDSDTDFYLWPGNGFPFSGNDPSYMKSLIGIWWKRGNPIDYKEFDVISYIEQNWEFPELWDLWEDQKIVLPRKI